MIWFFVVVAIVCAFGCWLENRSTRRRCAESEGRSAHRMSPSVMAAMEHECLSEEFLRLLRDAGELNHPFGCPVCRM